MAAAVLNGGICVSHLRVRNGGWYLCVALVSLWRSAHGGTGAARWIAWTFVISACCADGGGHLIHFFLSKASVAASTRSLEHCASAHQRQRAAARKRRVSTQTRRRG
jgi:hypothetical protein